MNQVNPQTTEELRTLLVDKLDLPVELVDAWFKAVAVAAVKNRQSFTPMYFNYVPMAADDWHTYVGIGDTTYRPGAGPLLPALAIAIRHDQPAGPTLDPDVHPLRGMAGAIDWMAQGYLAMLALITPELAHQRVGPTLFFSLYTNLLDVIQQSPGFRRGWIDRDFERSMLVAGCEVGDHTWYIGFDVSVAARHILMAQAQPVTGQTSRLN